MGQFGIECPICKKQNRIVIYNILVIVTLQIEEKIITRNPKAVKPNQDRTKMSLVY